MQGIKPNLVGAEADPERVTAQAKRHSFLAILLISSLHGCTIRSAIRVEQVEVAQDHIQFIVSSQQTSKLVDSYPTFFARRDYLLEWPVTGPDCVTTPPVRKIELTADRLPLNQSLGLNIDYFFGNNRDRVVRQIRNASGGEMKQEVTILGPADSRQKWRVLKSWDVSCDETKPTFINSVHGKWIVNTVNLHIIDTTSLTESPADPEVVRMVTVALSQPLGRSVEYCFSDDLSYLRVFADNTLNHYGKRGWFEKLANEKSNLGAGYYLQRGKPGIQRIDAHIEAGKSFPIIEWTDRSQRRYESFFGLFSPISAISDSAELAGLFQISHAWEVEAHQRVRIPPIPECRGVAIKTPVFANLTKTRVFDIARVFGK